MPRVRHRPEQSVLHRVVREHLDGFLRAAREEHGGLPAFVERTFRAYLKCGIPEHGFIRLHCAWCGHDDVVAFSCKRRGVCPSCSARAMGEGAAHLVDHVLPEVPLRQWVVSYPFELGGKLAFQPDLLRAVERLVTRILSTWMRERSGGKPGGVLVRHRFGASLNLHIHAHVLLLDGGYARDDDGTLRFCRSPPIRAEELDELAHRMGDRLVGLLRRRGLLQTEDVGNLAPEPSALEMLGKLAQSKGRRERTGPALADVEEEALEHPRGGMVANADGLNLYASPVIDGKDRESLEKMCRYLLRGPLALGRLKERRDGMLTYRLKKPDRWGNTVLVLAPMELLGRLCSLIPAPGAPVRCYFGVLAAGAKERKAVVPKPTERRSKACETGDAYAQSPVDWALLLKRVWGLDALECQRCGARMQAMAVIEDPAEAARFLAHAGESTVMERARGPPELAA